MPPSKAELKEKMGKKHTASKISTSEKKAASFQEQIA